MTSPFGYTPRELEARKFRETENGVHISILDSNSAGYDSFGRQRVSNPETLFDSKQLHDSQPLFWDDQEVSGSGTGSTHSTAKASTTLSVSATTAGKRVRQTFQRFNYQPGKSILVFLTGTLGASGGGAGITRSAGLFDDNNGIFMRDNEGTIEAVIRSKVSGSVVDNAIPQSSWNIDPLDGTGGSGITLTPTNSQIIVFDMEWLGVGRVRIGFVINGAIQYVHQFNHANVNENVYMSTPNLPLRYEIENDGTGGASSLEHICSTVISEGGNQQLGVLRHVDSGAVISLSSGTKYAALLLRLKSTHLDASALFQAISCLVTTNDTAHWELVFNPIVANLASSDWTDITNSCMQYAVGDNTFTVSGGTEIDGGYFSQTQPVQETVPNALRLGSAIDGTPDVIALCIQPISNNITVRSSITWREIT